jgi:hypothetical protein
MAEGGKLQVIATAITAWRDTFRAIGAMRLPLVVVAVILIR